MCTFAIHTHDNITPSVFCVSSVYMCIVCLSSPRHRCRRNRNARPTSTSWCSVHLYESFIMFIVIVSRSRQNHIHTDTQTQRPLTLCITREYNVHIYARRHVHKTILPASFHRSHATHIHHTQYTIHTHTTHARACVINARTHSQHIHTISYTRGSACTCNK